jgi:hypothetical protein
VHRRNHLVPIALAAALCLAAAPAAARLDLSLYAALLERHTAVVDDEAGVRVDYAGLRASSAWRRLVAGLAEATPPDAAQRDAKLAFWINIYNILAIQLVVQHEPEESIRDIGNLLRPVWKRRAGVVAGEPVTLDWIEHDVLRPMGDPRIHAAIVCASVSCPPLLREPWDPERVDAQLDAALRSFLADRRKGLRVDRSADAVRLSKIFDWFAGDFDDGAGVLAGLAPWLPPADRAWLADHPAPRIRYFPYDWRLNDLAAATAAFPSPGPSSRR